MKKLLNLLMILIVGVSTFLNIPSVNAASDHLYVDYSDGFTFAEVWNGNWISTPQNLIRRASDNSLVYCIQAHVVLADGASVVSSTDMNQLASRINRSPEAIDKVKLIAYYGYSYGNHTSIEWYMATQVAIWSVTDPDVYPTVARGNLTRTDRFDKSSLSLNIPECFKIPSTKVVFSWSTCAIIATFLFSIYIHLFKHRYSLYHK